MSILRDELLNDPLGRGYANFIPDSPGALADMLNATLYTSVKEKFLTARGLLASDGEAGAIILDKLDSAGQINSAVKWAMKFVISDGIDVGHPTTRGLLDQLVLGGVLTQQECDILKNKALQPASRAEVLGISYVRENDIRIALGE